MHGGSGYNNIYVIILQVVKKDECRYELREKEMGNKCYSDVHVRMKAFFMTHLQLSVPH